MRDGRDAGPPGRRLLVGGRPSAAQVRRSLPWFLAAAPSQGCAKGGQGAYNDALQRSTDDPSGTVPPLISTYIHAHDMNDAGLTGFLLYAPSCL